MVASLQTRPDALHEDRDPGLFGPGSVSWRVVGDPISGIAGLRALLLQALHPAAMAGVAQRSGFREDPWGRLVRTAEFVGVVTFGTTEQARQAGQRVRAVHERLTFRDGDRVRRVDEPELLAWVHAAEVESLLTVYRRAGGPMPREEADRFVAEQARAAALVGVPEALVPVTDAQLAATLDGYRPELRMTPDALDGLRHALWPPMPARVSLLTPARPGWVSLVSLAMATLPRWARRMYALPGLPTTDVATTVSLRALRSALLAIPRDRREGPQLRAARQRTGWQG